MSGWNTYKTTFNLSGDIVTLARNGDVRQLKEFLNSNPSVDINKKNQKGHSPLMISVYNGNQAVSALLLKRGADPNSSDLSGNTVLMGAAFKGDIKMVTLLLKWGALKELKNHSGFTAEEWAGAFGRKAVVSILSTTEKNQNRFKNFINALKILGSFFTPNTRKGVAA